MTSSNVFICADAAEQEAITDKLYNTDISSFKDTEIENNHIENPGADVSCNIQFCVEQTEYCINSENGHFYRDASDIRDFGQLDSDSLHAVMTELGILNIMMSDNG